MIVTGIPKSKRISIDKRVFIYHNQPYNVIALQEVNQRADGKVINEYSKYKIREDNFALVLN